MQTNIKNSQFINIYSDKIEKNTTKVVIQTLNEIIVGDFHHRPKLRLIDELISGEPYIAITDAVVYDHSGTVRFRTKFLSVNREHVVYFIPWDDLEREQDTYQFLP